jgi:hypothetical protein
MVAGAGALQCMDVCAHVFRHERAHVFLLSTQTSASSNSGLERRMLRAARRGRTATRARRAARRGRRRRPARARRQRCWSVVRRVGVGGVGVRRGFGLSVCTRGHPPPPPLPLAPPPPPHSTQPTPPRPAAPPPRQPPPRSRDHRQAGAQAPGLGAVTSTQSPPFLYLVSYFPSQQGGGFFSSSQLRQLLLSSLI